MKSLRTALLCTALIAASSATADDGFSPSRMPELDQAYQSIVTIPGTDLHVAEIQGQLVIVLPNKRFAVVGHLVDTLEKKELRTLDDVKAARRTKISSLGINYDDLAAVKYGNGPKEAVIFIDTECTNCTKMLQEVRALGREYTFHIVMVPLLAQASVTNAAKVVCATDPKAAVEAIFTRGYASLPAQSPKCAQAKLAATWGMSMALSIRAVPYVIAPNGETTLGLKDTTLTQFLGSNRS